MTPDTQHPELQAFHDGELPRGAAAAVRAHIAACPLCREELRLLRSLDSLLKRKETFNDISGAVLARVGTAAPVGDQESGWWKLPALALASVAVYALCVETGLLPDRSRALMAAVTAQKETRELSALLFGRSAGGKEEMLAMLLEGE